MRTRNIEGFIRHLDPDDELEIGEETPAIEAAFEKLPLPMDLKRLLQWCWPQKYAQIGPIEWYDAGSILSDDWQARLLTMKLIKIGKGGNGDALVIDFEDPESCPVGFIRMPYYVRPNSRKDEMYFEAESSLERFFFRAAEGLYLPGDSYECEEWEAFRRDLELKKPQNT